MVTTNRLSIVLVSILLALTACTSTPEEPVVADPEGFADDFRYFESAYNEMTLAIHSTPEWKTRPQYDKRVRGLAEIALVRAEALRPYIEQELISDAAIKLIKREVTERARLESFDLKTEGGTYLLEPDAQLTSFEEERAYHRIWQQIETLESFALAQKTTPWIDDVVIASARGDLQRILATQPMQTSKWTRIRVSPESFVDDQERAQDLLDRLDGKAPEMPVD